MLNVGRLENFERNDMSRLFRLGDVLGGYSKVGIGFVEIIFKIWREKTFVSTVCSLRAR